MTSLAMGSALEAVQDAVRNEAAAHRQDMAITMARLMAAE